MKELNQRVKVKFLRYSIQNAMGHYPYVVEKRNITGRVYQDSKYHFYYGRLNTILDKESNITYIMDLWKMRDIENQYRSGDLIDPIQYAIGIVERECKDYFITHIDEGIEDPIYCSLIS